jgi:hypothetical protein
VGAQKGIVAVCGINENVGLGAMAAWWVGVDVSDGGATENGTQAVF